MLKTGLVCVIYKKSLGKYCIINTDKYKTLYKKVNVMGSQKNKISKRSIPVKLGEEYIITIQGMGNNGEGVGRYEDFTVFIPFTLPGEVIKTKITQYKKNYAVGRIIEIIEAAPNRVVPKCDVYGTCGGCQLQHVSYEGQLALKTQKVRDIIARIAKMDPVMVEATLGAKQPWNYRNKMQMPVAGTAENLKMGFYAMGSHDIVENFHCHIQMDLNNKLASVCYDIMTELHIAPYDELTGEGVVRHIIGRVAPTGIMVIIVTAVKNLPQQETWVARIRETIPEVTSIVANYNPKNTNVIMGRECNVLWGASYIVDTIEDLTFRLSPHSFFQVNPVQTSVLYGKALEFADLTGGETVVDAYCGTGTISLFMAHNAKKVIGIEIVEPAIIDARNNAKSNGFTNTEFIVADAAKAMPALYNKGVRVDVIVFDPIRAGCKEEVLRAAASMQPKRMVYVSCNPASMARDIAILDTLGYKTVKVQPVDMFPMTAHVETVTLLTKKEVTQ